MPITMGDEGGKGGGVSPDCLYTNDYELTSTHMLLSLHRQEPDHPSVCFLWLTTVHFTMDQL